MTTLETQNPSASFPNQTTAGGDPCQECPAGTFSKTSLLPTPVENAGASPGAVAAAPGISLSPSPDKNARSIRPNATRRLVRADYHRQIKLTYAEAALIAGIRVTTMERWVSEGKIPRVAKAGPYRIYRPHLDEYLRTGVRVKA